MKRYVWFFLNILVVAVESVSAQEPGLPLPAACAIHHYRLNIGYDQTTVLLFPAPVLAGDKGKGNEAFIVQPQPGMQNVLKIKAAHRHFTPSNLHVFTSDGNVYAYDVIYTDTPQCTTYDFGRIGTGCFSRDGHDDHPGLPGGQYYLEPSLRVRLKAIMQDPARSKRSVTRNGIVLRLMNVYSADSLLFFLLRIRNHSPLPYEPDFIRLSLQGRRLQKRTSYQTTTLLPVYMDQFSPVPANGTWEGVLGVRQFTIPALQQCLVEVHERRGSRQLPLVIKNGVFRHIQSL